MVVSAQLRTSAALYQGQKLSVIIESESGWSTVLPWTLRGSYGRYADYAAVRYAFLSPAPIR
jgi:hypothetical protein